MNIRESALRSVSITQAQDAYRNNRTRLSAENTLPLEESFGSVLNREQELHFSGHAKSRLQSRGIQMTDLQMKRLNSAKSQAQEKGIRESLIMLDNLAFIVNVPSNTVITAMDRDEHENKVFTNIDGAVIA